MLALLTSQVAAQHDERPITVVVDGEQLEFQMKPYVEKGTMLVPFRPIFTKLGLSMEWDSTARKVIGRRQGLVIELQIGSTTAWVNGKSYQLAVAPALKEGHTFVPLRFVSEHAEREISWNESKRVVYIAKREELIYQLIGDLIGSQRLVSDNGYHISYEMKELKNDQALVEVKLTGSGEQSVWHYRAGWVAGQWTVLSGQLRHVNYRNGHLARTGTVTTSEVYRIVIRAVIEASLSERDGFRYTLGKVVFLSGDDQSVKLKYSVFVQRASDGYSPDYVAEHVAAVMLDEQGQWKLAESHLLGMDYRIAAVKDIMDEIDRKM